ncbi:hypothetical protein A1O7_00908 [Cladophialophora yegresii CBS 114405]|uniref:Single-strand DNA deaminase toxin A-like C-terminal domain-containing protein n=1 Tax=Cladophialophora yegresii CBS 114405 TaxID=1182544 RepID=W9WIW6_9EURO|nr:uncharacterized protein A1O7_00908 [Cladophialophora yegresii CBS 114405]EXJ64571.1 hypothetical protein A1O7_00908 [Cladophialophora yegresii CBS 114405]
MDTEDGFYSAAAQWWDVTTVKVKCPICLKLHRHGFSGSYDQNLRATHCDTSQELGFPSYRLTFPFSTSSGGTAYEIDKINVRYVAVDADPTALELPPLRDSSDNHESDKEATTTPPKLGDARETITLDASDHILSRLTAAFGGSDEPYTTNRIDHVTSRMLHFGDEDYVKEYLDTSSEAELFLHGVDEKGDSILYTAAAERYSGIVRLLLERGADPNFQNKRGRTALTEAALWGRCQNVKVLLKHGADRSLKDHDGFIALQFAEPSARNEEERYDRSGGKVQAYKETTHTANQQRRMIVHLLSGAQEVPSLITRTNYQHHVFVKSTDNIRLFAPISEYPIPTQWKTVARLERGGRYPSVSAMSGWAHNQTVILISGKDWTAEVMRICQLVNHQLMPHIYDNGKSGRYHASHAEKQMIAYFINHHVFLEPELGKQDATDDAVEQLASAMQNWGFHPTVDRSLRGLASMVPPVMLRRALILVSQEPCADCATFIEHVTSKLGLDIMLSGWGGSHRAP